jgi:hypothetical protein
MEIKGSLRRDLSSAAGAAGLKVAHSGLARLVDASAITAKPPLVVIYVMYIDRKSDHLFK